MILSHRTLLIPVLLLTAATTAHGEMRTGYDDAIVVERSELIVIGRLDGESIQKVMHERSSDGQSWEFHANLLITEVLKGKATKGVEIPIVIHYGLSPGDLRQDGKIGIWDSGNSAMSFSPLIEDAQADNLWFLRRRAGKYGREPGTGNYGIVDPEDVQPLELEEYFLAYLSSDPGTELEIYARRNPDMRERMARYLTHLEIQRILKIEDPSERFDKLQPYFLSGAFWDGKFEAREGLLSCGSVAGERLTKLFTDPRYHERRREIIDLWWKMGYRDAAPLLIHLLKKLDRYWKRQRLEKDWWNSNSGETHQRRENYEEVYGAVHTLRKLQDPRARAVLEATRDRWKPIGPDGLRIVKECEGALKELAELGKAVPPQ